MKNKYKYILLIFVSFIMCNTKIYSQNTTHTMNELSKKLITTEGGIWVTEGAAKSDDLYYYVFQFSKDNNVIFSYNTRENGSARWNWTTNVLQYGTFKTDGNILTINFTSAKNKQSSSDKPIPKNLCIEIEIAEIAENKIMVKEHRGKAFYLKNPDYIPKDVEITEYKLILKQISGKNIFENHGENAKIELVAERPIID